MRGVRGEGGGGEGERGRGGEGETKSPQVIKKKKHF